MDIQTLLNKRQLSVVRKNRPEETVLLILILPHLDYCSAVWGCIGNGLSQKLEKLQNRAARIITGSSWDASSAPILHVYTFRFVTFY